MEGAKAPSMFHWLEQCPDTFKNIVVKAEKKLEELMNPKELIKYARLWGWTRDDLIVAASSLLTEATHDSELVKNNCPICGGDKVIFGKPCGSCNP